MARPTRRQFLQASVAASTAFSTFTIAGTKSSGKVIGANDTIRVAVAGINGRGGSHIDSFAGGKQSQVTYLIDPDRRLFEKRIKHVERKGDKAPKCVQDFREALDDKNVDVLTIATPNHWHAPLTIFACQAGKDVYVEKPCSHNIHEGRIAVDMARKHGRIVQHGTQHRSGTKGLYAAELAKSGKVGKLLIARGMCYKNRGSINSKEAAPPPEGLDFNLWLGPAKEQPYHGNLVHYNWHWFWDFGNGDIGNQGVHEMDQARWGIPGATWPKSVMSIGGRFGYTDQGETANTQVAIFDYGETQLIFEVRGLKSDKYYDQGTGNTYHYEGGVLAGGKFYPKGSTTGGELPAKFNLSRSGSGNHTDNFIAAVRSRKSDELYADILEGHYSSGLCHLANASYRLATDEPFDTRTKTFGDNKDAFESVERMGRHLAANGVKLDGLKYRVGKHLKFDGDKEKFIGDDAANALITRQYRAPFNIPEKVV